MKTEVRYGSKFLKSYHKATPKIRAAFKKRRRLFKKDPFHPTLNNHQLSGKYRGYRSINITGDWRALYIQHNKTIVFEALGTHSQLYQ